MWNSCFRFWLNAFLENKPRRFISNYILKPWHNFSLFSFFCILQGIHKLNSLLEFVRRVISRIFFIIHKYLSYVKININLLKSNIVQSFQLSVCTTVINMYWNTTRICASKIMVCRHFASIELLNYFVTIGLKSSSFLQSVRYDVTVACFPRKWFFHYYLHPKLKFTNEKVVDVKCISEIIHMYDFN